MAISIYSLRGSGELHPGRQLRDGPLRKTLGLVQQELAIISRDYKWIGNLPSEKGSPGTVA